MRNYITKPTAISLLGANIGLLLVAIVYDWSFITIIWTFWCQSLLMGFLHIDKKHDDPTGTIKNFGMWIGIHIFYAIFLLAFSYMSMLNAGVIEMPEDTYVHPAFNMGAPNLLQITMGAVLFFIVHLFSRIKNKKRASMDTLWARIVVMHLTIVLGAFLTIMIPGKGMLIIFMLVKTIADVKGHISEHF